MKKLIFASILSITLSSFSNETNIPKDDFNSAVKAAANQAIADQSQESYDTAVRIVLDHFRNRAQKDYDNCIKQKNSFFGALDSFFHPGIDTCGDKKNALMEWSWAVKLIESIGDAVTLERIKKIEIPQLREEILLRKQAELEAQPKSYQNK